MDHPRRRPHRPRRLPWLIRRTIDADAEFVFVTDPADVPPDATPFDMRGVDLGHHGSDCSFETILRGLYEYYHRAGLLGREPA